MMEDSANSCLSTCMGPQGFRSLQLQESAARSVSRNPTSATSSMVEREQETDQYNYHQKKKIRRNPQLACRQENEGVSDSQVRELASCNATSKATRKLGSKVRHRNILCLLR